MIRLIPFQKKYQASVDSLINEIAKEFPYPISTRNANVKSKLIDKYWIVVAEDIVIGTIAILRIKDENAILKRMFVSKKYRGQEKGISSLLLSTWTQLNRCK